MSEISKKTPTKMTADYMLKVKPQKASRRSDTGEQKRAANEFIRDRDRILGSKAFRRLAGKAQVFITGVDDHMRTRLTHTLEVSQIARTIAVPLKLDLELVEAIAMGHDMGHTPYGHVGERTLHEIMTPQQNHVLGKRCPMNMDDPATFDYSAFADLQGFKHNLQSLVVAMKLERNYTGYGMDLTNFTHYGMMAHSRSTYSKKRIRNHDALGYYKAFLDEGCTADGGNAWSLESLLVAEADEIAQYCHDVEDALFGGLITPGEIKQIMTDHFGDFGIFPELPPAEAELLERPENYDLGEFVALISRCLVNMLVNRTLLVASYHIDRIGREYRLSVREYQDFRRDHRPDDDLFGMIFSYSYTPEERAQKDGFARRVGDFQDTIVQRVLSSYDIQKADAKGRYIITKLFQAYYETPQQLPDRCVYELLSNYKDLAVGA